ncbi:FAD-binding domain-containing protein [Zopfia rhizophila CBS 207.26]|uniref:FAD-binding domain-containing protein n=1 Tax=Zopfia rhizophila CBS 207.26 TaxID=1314779 RepID=A0A6A6DWH3_9PEZI|nr:FAD-binding domain-containing protein [Zopfia rhizophila CBS 207.26]
MIRAFNMVTKEDIKTALPSTCSVVVPDLEREVNEVVDRWSEAGISHPYAIVTPNTEDDIIATIQYARRNGLKIVPVNGGHGAFVPINRKTIYLDMKIFKDVVLDEEKEEVRIGGGCVAGDVLGALTERGWYTLTPNSNPVGMIGAILGGGSGSLNALHGFTIDHVKSITIIPFSSPSAEHSSSLRSIMLTPSSRGEEKSLFNVLCGAGHGLGIITSLTLRAWKIQSLNLTHNSIWTRRLLFPASEIPTAAQLYTSLLPPPPALSPVLAFLRAPPSAPNPGLPLIMLALSYFGPAADAEKAVKCTYGEVENKATSVFTTLTPWSNMNAAAVPLNVHGGFKEYHGCLVKEVDGSSVEDSFEKWKEFTEDVQGRGRSYVVIGSWDTERLEGNAGEEDEKFFSPRGNGVFVQCTPWYVDLEGKGWADGFGKAVVECMRCRDTKEGRRRWAFANNVAAGQDMREVYSEEQLEKIRRVKQVWDRGNVGWSPVMDGWEE